LSVTPTTAASSSNAERTHVIASGDTFEALAQKYFNDSTKWQLIAKANPTVEPERLKIGQKIRIPAGGSTATLAADTSAQSVTSPARSINTSGGSFHTVAKGETPSSISRKYYGSDKYWRQILAANKGTTEKNLKVGQKLTIPAKDTIVGAENVGGRGS
jgi:nucleoid-associated protein YgaU